MDTRTTRSHVTVAYHRPSIYTKRGCHGGNTTQERRWIGLCFSSLIRRIIFQGAKETSVKKNSSRRGDQISSYRLSETPSTPIPQHATVRFSDTLLLGSQPLIVQIGERLELGTRRRPFPSSTSRGWLCSGWGRSVLVKGGALCRLIWIKLKEKLVSKYYSKTFKGTEGNDALPKIEK